jgi:ribonuclease HII
MSRAPDTDWWCEERAARERGFRVIAGIDEAGRGPLAGPVVAAAVVLPHQTELPGVRDSKVMTPEQREEAYDLIFERAEAVGVGVVDVADIDRMNILRATHHAMRCAVDAMPVRPEFALIDGLPVHPFPILQRALVKGDCRSVSIAAASIIAKVTRDRIMRELDGAYPDYGFADHKGYSTPLHLERLQRLGPCPIHRRSFAPVAQFYGGPERPHDPSIAQTSLSFAEDGRRATGQSGETIAAAYLRSLGWDLLETRFRCRGGEIDVIARDNGTLAFVEVKARRGARAPSEAVDARKRARLVTAAEEWLAANGGNECVCRFDVLEVVFGRNGMAKVNLIRNAFVAGE